MRIGPVSLVALLVVLAIAAYVTAQSVGGGHSSAGGSTGLGAYQGAINAARSSAAAQDAAAASTHTLP